MGAEFGETGVGNNNGNRSSDPGTNGYITKVIEKQISDREQNHNGDQLLRRDKAHR